MHDPNDMLRLLMRLSLHYPQARYTDDELRALALDWTHDLDAYPPDVLRDAARDLRRRERYFPGVATMIEYAAAIVARRRAARRELPASPLTDAGMSRNGRLAWLLRRKMDGDAAAAREFEHLLGQAAGRAGLDGEAAHGRA